MTTEQKLASCPLNHSWPVSAELFSGMAPRREGKRGGYKTHNWKATPERCPTCGHKWSRMEPTIPREEDKGFRMLLGQS